MTGLEFSPYSSLSREKILHQVHSQMSQRRFDHCLRVEKKIIELATLYGADIILMDLVMPVMDGIEATKDILSKWKEAKIIIVTSFIDDEKVYPAISAGAKSYLLKTSSASEIAQAIRDTYRGEGVFEKEVSEKLEHRHEVEEEFRLFEELTSREKEVLLLIAQGKSNQEIADECFITLKTVKTHVSNILSKLQVEDRTQATIYAFKHHLVKP